MNDEPGDESEAALRQLRRRTPIRGRRQTLQLCKLAPALLRAPLDGLDLVLRRAHVRVGAIGLERLVVQVGRVELLRGRR